MQDLCKLPFIKDIKRVYDKWNDRVNEEENIRVSEQMTYLL